MPTEHAPFRDALDDYIFKQMESALAGNVPYRVTVEGPGGIIPLWKMRELMGYPPEQIPLHDPAALELWLSDGR